MGTFTTQPTKQLKTPTKMDFRFFGQPFVQAFGVPPRCQRYQQRCHCRPNRSSHPSFGAHGPWTMDQLLEEARRQVKAEQASGAVGDYFAFLDSMLNGCHQRAQQQTSAKPAEKPEENGEKQEMKNQEKPKNETSETTEDKCFTFNDLLGAIFHELTKDQSNESPKQDKPKFEAPETSDEKYEKENQGHESNAEPSEKSDDIEPEAKDEPIVEAVEASKPVNAARLTTKVMVNEDLEKVQIQIDFSGFQFKPEHLDVQLIDENVLAVSAEEGEHKFERKFKLPKSCQLDKIMPKFKDEETKQSLTITIPKEVKKVINIPISTSDNE